MSNNFPEDRSHLMTEQRLEQSADLDIQDVTQLLTTINQQDQLVALAVGKAIPQISQLVTDLTNRMKKGGRLFYIGAGTSGRLGVLDASECPPTFCCDPGEVVGIIAGGDGSLRRSSEGAEDEREGGIEALKKHNFNEKDMLVGIAAGGTTPYVWGALEYAKNCDAATAMICCVQMPKPLSVDINYMIELLVGPEVLTGSTRLKAGTATKLVLNMITTATMVKRGKAWGNLMVDVKASNIKLRDRAARIIAKQCKINREQASQLLEQAHGQVKAALVMDQLKVSYEQAVLKIQQCDGNLRDVLGEPL